MLYPRADKGDGLVDSNGFVIRASSDVDGVAGSCFAQRAADGGAGCAGERQSLLLLPVVALTYQGPAATAVSTENNKTPTPPSSMMVNIVTQNVA